MFLSGELCPMLVYNVLTAQWLTVEFECVIHGPMAVNDVII
uniref:Uncharacterized protein n=1 Tax=Anguilla anguilla TaxID=7936 RepID=A0A0E9SNV5_ANGAN